jgi:hypothetical protein
MIVATTVAERSSSITSGMVVPGGLPDYRGGAYRPRVGLRHERTHATRVHGLLAIRTEPVLQVEHKRKRVVDGTLLLRAQTACELAEALDVHRA